MVCIYYVQVLLLTSLPYELGNEVYGIVYGVNKENRSTCVQNNGSEEALAVWIGQSWCIDNINIPDQMILWEATQLRLLGLSQLFHLKETHILDFVFQIFEQFIPFCQIGSTDSTHPLLSHSQRLQPKSAWL